MSTLAGMLEELRQLPEYLIPSLGLSCSPSSLKLRPSLLDLADRFASCTGWSYNKPFIAWALKQEWRSCLPVPLVFLGIDSPLESRSNGV